MLGDGVEGDSRAPFRVCNQSCLMKEAETCSIRRAQVRVPGTGNDESKGSGVGRGSVYFKE